MHPQTINQKIRLLLILVTLVLQNQQTNSLFATPADPQEAPMRFDLPIPHFDTIIFEGNMDILTGAFTFSGYPAKKVLDFDILKIKDPSFSFSNTDGLQMEATVVFLNQEITTIKLETFQYNKLVLLSLKLPTPFTIPIAPQRSLIFEKLYIKLTPTEKSIYATTSLTGKPDGEITAELGVQPAEKGKIPFIVLTLQNLSLSSLFANLEKTAADNIILAKSRLHILDPFTPERHITLDGTINLSGLKLPGLAPKSKLDNVMFSSTINPDGGFELEAALASNLTLIPKLLTLKETKLTITNAPPTDEKNTSEQTKNLTVTLAGTTDLKAPIIGTINTTLSASMLDGQFDVFEGNLNRSINLLNKLTITNTRAVYSKAENSFKVIGDARFAEHDITARLKIISDEGKIKVTFAGDVKSQKPLKPFENFPSKALKNITIEKLGVGLDSPNTFYLQGEGSLLNTRCHIKITNLPDDNILLTGETLDEAKLTDIIPGLSRTPLKSLHVPKFSIIASSAEYKDLETKLLIPAGFSILSTIDPTDKNFDMIRFLLKDVSKELNLTANWSGPDNFAFGFSIPTEFKVAVGKKCTLTWENIYLMLNGAVPDIQFSANTKIRAKIPNQTQELTFIASMAVIPVPTPEIKVTGNMLGMWENVLGLKGVAVGDVGLVFGARIVPIPAPPGVAITPSKLGFAGKLYLSDTKKIDVAALFSDSDELLLYGKFDGTIGTNDLLAIPNKKWNLNIPTKNIPELTIKNVELKVAPRNTRIGPLLYKQGLTLRGELSLSHFGPLDFSGVHGIVDANIDLSGINIEGGLSKVKLGKHFELTRAKTTKPEIVPGDGPIFKLALTPTEQLIYLSGKMVLFGFESETKVTVSPTRVAFMTHQQLFGFCDTLLEGTSLGSVNDKNLDFTINGHITQPKKLSITKQDLVNLKQKALKRLTTKQATVQKNIATLRGAIKQRKAYLYANNIKNFKNITDAFNKAETALNKAEDKVRTLENQIKPLAQELEKTLAQMKTTTTKIKHGTQAFTLWTKLKALQVALVTATAGVEVALAVVRRAHNAIQTVSDTELLGLKSKLKYQKARSQFIEARRINRTNMLDALIFSEPLINQLTSFSIKELSFAASARGFLKKGALPIISCTVMKGEKTFAVTIDADIQDFEDLFLNIIYSIFNKIRR